MDHNGPVATTQGRKRERSRSKRVRKRPRSEQQQQLHELEPGLILSLHPVLAAASEGIDDAIKAAGPVEPTTLRQLRQHPDQPRDHAGQEVPSALPSTTVSPLVRVIPPYPYTFFSFCKERWIGRTVLDVYTTEFGSYPPSYYEMAIQQGRIKVSDEAVDVHYRLKGADVLQHTVHRHEPAVAVQIDTPPYLTIVGETDTLLAIDKPSTIPVHPCGGYHRNSVMKLLEESFSPTICNNDTNGNNDTAKLFTIHRLDRLTSGLLVLAKTSAAAKEWGNAIQQRDCQKVYLARVKGRFCNPLSSRSGRGSTPTALDVHSAQDHRADSIPLLSPEHYPEYGEYQHSTDSVSGSSDGAIEGMVSTTLQNNTGSQHNQERRSRFANGYWLADSAGRTITPTDQTENTREVCDDTRLRDFSTTEHDIDEWLDDLNAVNANTTAKPDHQRQRPLVWLHLACPVRIEQPKIGVCSAGLFDDLDSDTYQKTVKPAQTAFGVVHYYEEDDSTLLIVRPITGRTHQIRIHLQYLGHCIANDPNYGGSLWFGNPEGEKLCGKAKAILEQNPVSAWTAGDLNDDGRTSSSRVTSDEPATEAEVEAYMNQPSTTRGEQEDLSVFIQRTCVWCARQQGHSVAERAVFEFLVRSPGLWLHALQYKVKTMSFRTELPTWCQF